MKSMISKIAAFTLVLVMAVTMVPSEAYAGFYEPIGGYGPHMIYGPDDYEYKEDGQHALLTIGTRTSTGSQTYTYGGANEKKTFYYLENEYIRFGLREDGVHMLTMPTAVKNKESDMYSKSIFQQMMFGFSYDRNGAMSKEGLTPPAAKVSFFEGNKIKAEYNFNSVSYNGAKYSSKVTVVFELVKLADSKDHKNNYGVRSYMYHDGGFGNVGEGRNFYYGLKYSKFNTMGHPDANPGDAKAQTLSRDNKGRVTYSTLQDYVGFTSVYGANVGAVCEIVSNNYNWANPFVCLSSFNGKYVQSGSPDGSIPYNFPDQFEYYIGILQAFNNAYDGNFHLWGFRDLQSAGTQQSTPADVVTVSQSATQLGIFKTGNSFIAESAENEAAMSKLKTKHGSAPVALLRGDLVKQGTNYVFTNGEARLSPTITAKWTKGSGSLTVSSTGIITQSGINLNSPSFKFYEPKSGKNASLQLKVDATNGLVATMKPADNSSILHIDIPYATVALNSSTIDTTGNLVFNGTLSMETVFNGAGFTMNKLGYGYKDNQFKVNGVQAKGHFDTAKLFNLELAKVNGEINTFAEDTSYEFSLELNAFDMFKAEAELTLVRFKDTGALMPNYLWGYIEAQPGVPLVPPIVVARLTGGGAGFDKLATTVNGDFLVIPPIRLKGSASVSLFHFVDARGSLVFGPGYIETVLSDIKLFNTDQLNFMQEMSLSAGLEAQTRTYQGIQYTGMMLNASTRMKAKLPSVTLDLIDINGSLRVGAFAGLDHYDNNVSKVYLLIAGNGTLSADLHTPSDWPSPFDGIQFFGAEAEAAIGVQTAIDVKGGLQKAFESIYDNGSVYFGVVANTSFLGSKLRVWYIKPAKGGSYWGKMTKLPLQDMPGWSWSSHGFNTLSAAMPLQDETGEQVGLMGMETNMPVFTLASSMELLEAPVMPLENDETIVDADGNEPSGLEKDGASSEAMPLPEILPLEDVGAPIQAFGTMGPGPQSIVFAAGAAEDSLYILIVPKDEATFDAFKSELKVYAGPATSDPEVPLKWMSAVTNNGQVDVAALATVNALEVSSAEGEKGILVHVGNGGVDQTFTVNAGTYEFKSDKGLLAPPTSFDAILNGVNVEGEVKNPEANKTYVMRTYLGTTLGGTDYPIDQRETTDPGPTICPIPISGTDLPTGTYYVTVYLDEEVKDDFNGNNQLDPEEVAYLNVGKKEIATPVIYTNTFQPDAPTNVAITPIGNEVMQGSWAQVPGAEGYKVTVYQENSSSVWVDTGVGYQFDAADFTSVSAHIKSGMRYDSASGTYTVDMALTGGGTGNGVPNGLVAGIEYKIGVQAYKYMVEYPVYGSETQSSSAMLPAYVPLDMVLSVNDKILKKDEDTGVYTVDIKEHPSVLKAEATGQSTATFTVERMDSNAMILQNSDDSFNIPDDFEGTLMLKVEGSLLNSTFNTRDTTERFVLVQFDNLAPVVTLDSGYFRADPKTGFYTITGTTEPGVKVEGFGVMADPQNSGPVGPTVADSAGRFAMSGYLRECGFDGDGNALFIGKQLSFSGSDPLGNISDLAFTLVSAPVDYNEQWAGGVNSYTQGSGMDLSFSMNRDFSLFDSVRVDDEVLTLGQFNAEAGSTIITLYSRYLDTLSVGTHLMTVHYTDGVVIGSQFEVLAARPGGTGNRGTGSPTTGDDSNMMLWIGLMIIAAAAISILILRKRKTDKAKQ